MNDKLLYCVLIWENLVIKKYQKLLQNKNYPIDIKFQCPMYSMDNKRNNAISKIKNKKTFDLLKLQQLLIRILPQIWLIFNLIIFTLVKSYNYPILVTNIQLKVYVFLPLIHQHATYPYKTIE